MRGGRRPTEAGADRRWGCSYRRGAAARSRSGFPPGGDDAAAVPPSAASTIGAAQPEYRTSTGTSSTPAARTHCRAAACACRGDGSSAARPWSTPRSRRAARHSISIAGRRWETRDGPGPTSCHCSSLSKMTLISETSRSTAATIRRRSSGLTFAQHKPHSHRGRRNGGSLRQPGEQRRLRREERRQKIAMLDGPGSVLHDLWRRFSCRSPPLLCVFAPPTEREDSGRQSMCHCLGKRNGKPVRWSTSIFIKGAMDSLQRALTGSVASAAMVFSRSSVSK